MGEFPSPLADHCYHVSKLWVLHTVVKSVTRETKDNGGTIRKAITSPEKHSLNENPAFNEYSYCTVHGT